jgi:hypothetical protein
VALIPIRGRPLLSSTPPVHLLPQPSTPLPSLGNSSSPSSFLPDTASTPLFHRVDDVFFICRPQQLPSPAPSLLCEAAVKAQCPSHSEPNPPYLRRIRPEIFVSQTLSTLQLPLVNQYQASLAMASGHNIQDIPVPSAWGNYFRYHNSRTKEVTLSDWQHAFDRVRCCIKFNWAANSNNDMIRIMPSDIARISFNFGGGTEIPYLCLRMSLPKAPNDPNPVVMMVFWTAWSERGVDQTRSPSPLGEDPPAGRYSFSSRLYKVSFETKDLPSNVAEQTGWAVKPTYFIGWKSEESPYCIGFNASLQGLSAQQTFIAQQFRLLRNTNLDVNILTASLGTLMLGWQQLASMPSPTIPPYARYNSRFNRTLNRLEFIRDVDDIGVDGNVRS